MSQDGRGERYKWTVLVTYSVFLKLGLPPADVRDRRVTAVLACLESR